MHIILWIKKIEGRLRSFLRRSPILYALVGGLGVVLFWKGVWEMATLIPLLYGPTSAVIGMLILLISGLLVSVFIGDKITISETESEKRLTEKTEQLSEKTEGEVKGESITLTHIQDELKHIEQDIKSIAGKV